MRLKILTFNTLGTPFFAKDITQRYQKIAELINGGDYDIVCLQELFSHYNHYLFQNGLTKYPYKAVKPMPLGLQGGLAIFSKLPLTLERFHLYTYPPGTPIPFYTKLARSGILIAKLQDLPLRIATTHLTTDTIHNLTPKNKYYQLIRSQILQAAEIFNEKDYSVILTGDFNTAKDSILYKEFLQETAATDAFALFKDITYSPERTPYRFPAEEASRIDYIFYKQNKLKIKPTHHEHVFAEPSMLRSGKRSYLSDHIGLSVTLEMI